MKKLPIVSCRSGQALLVTLLILAIILTVGLSVISSSVTDIKISKQTEEASRAFYVAESALEEHLLLPYEAAPTGSIGGIGYEVTKVDLGGEEFLFPDEVNSGEPQIFWLVGHNENGEINFSQSYKDRLNFYWGNQDTEEKPALGVSYVYFQNGKYYLSRYNFDPDVERRNSNNFDPASSGSYSLGGKILKYSASITSLPGGSGSQPYFLILTLYYNSNPQFLGIKGGGSLPSQGYCFTSTATVPESGITKRVQQCQLWKNLPETFYYGLLSGGDLAK